MDNLESFLNYLILSQRHDANDDRLLAARQARDIAELETMAANFAHLSPDYTPFECWKHSLNTKWLVSHETDRDYNKLFVYHALIFAVQSQDSDLFDYLYFEQEELKLSIRDLTAKNFLGFEDVSDMSTALPPTRPKLQKYDYLGFISFHGAHKLLSHVLSKIKFKHYWDSEQIVEILCAASAGIFFRIQHNLTLEDQLETKVFHREQAELVQSFLTQVPLIQKDFNTQQMIFACQQYLGSKSLFKNRPPEMLHQKKVCQLVRQYILLSTPTTSDREVQESSQIRLPLRPLHLSQRKRKTSESEPVSPRGRVRTLH